MKSLLFLLAQLALPLLGSGAALHPSVRGLPLLARAGAALALGTVGLTVTAVLLSTFGIRWSIPALVVPPLALSLLLSRLWWRRPAEPRAPYRPSRAVAGVAAGAAGVALLHLGSSLVTASVTSHDFVYFWGVKAARFAEARAIDSSLLKGIFFFHGVPDYPPSVPVVQAWGAIWAGALPWRFVPVLALLWLVAAGPLLLELLRRRLGDDAATAVTAFWVAAMSISLARSYSGGNAEAPLVFFETLAVAALLVEDPGRPTSRFLPALMLAGAALTKVEGSAAALFITAGSVLRDLLERRPRILARHLPLVLAPTAALATWFFFQARHGLTVGFRPHGDLLTLHANFLPSILETGLRSLDAGTRGLSWGVPILFLLLSRPDPRRLLPALTLTAGLFAFLAFDYMHDASDPATRIRWTLPRVTQPGLSACILAAGVASLARAGPVIKAAGRPPARNVGP